MNDKKIVPVEQVIPGVDTRGLVYESDGRSVPFQVNPHKNLKRCYAFDYSYTENLFDEVINPRGFDIFSKFGGQTVVDLGAGSSSHGLRLCVLGSARSYVGVEPYHALTLSRSLSGTQEIPVSLVSDDALSFLRRLPDSSVSVWMAGIDDCVINNGDYWVEIGMEIPRVLHSDGALIEYYSVMSNGNIRKNLRLHESVETCILRVNCWVRE